MSPTHRSSLFRKSCHMASSCFFFCSGLTCRFEMRWTLKSLVLSTHIRLSSFPLLFPLVLRHLRDGLLRQPRGRPRPRPGHHHPVRQEAVPGPGEAGGRIRNAEGGQPEDPCGDRREADARGLVSEVIVAGLPTLGKI